MKQHLGYLSGAPRVSTRPDAENTGARSHVLGISRAFKALDWDVKYFIVGDKVSSKWVTKGSEKAVSSGFVRTLAADLVRLSLGVVNARRAWQELSGQVTWVYERFAALQSLGWIFKHHGVTWILETNAPLFYESKTDRKSLVLSSLARSMEIRAYRDCDVLVCISETLKEIVVSEANISPEKVVVLPNGVDTELFNPERHKPHVFEEFTIGFVGSLYPWQELNLLLEAVHELRAEGINLLLVIVGDGSMREAWQKQAQQLGIAEKVKFVGQVPWQDVPQYIGGFDLAYSGQVQLQVGKMYLSPLKLYEYMAMAKPVLASAFEDTKRVIRDGETGFLFEAGNKIHLKQVISRAYHSQAMLTEMGRKAREEIIASHSWASRVRTLIAEVERIQKKSQ